MYWQRENLTVQPHGASDLCVRMLRNVTAVDEEHLVSLGEPRQTQVGRSVRCYSWHYHRCGLVRAALHSIPLYTAPSQQTATCKYSL